MKPSASNFSSLNPLHGLAHQPCINVLVLAGHDDADDAIRHREFRPDQDCQERPNHDAQVQEDHAEADPRDDGFHFASESLADSFIRDLTTRMSAPAMVK